MIRCPVCGCEEFICAHCYRRYKPPEQTVVDLLRRYGNLTGYQLAKRMSYGKSRMYEILAEMVASGEIVKMGKRGGYAAPAEALRLVA